MKPPFHTAHTKAQSDGQIFQDAAATPNSTALQFLKDIKAFATSWCAVYFNLSQLKLSNQTQSRLDHAKAFLEKNLSNCIGRVFILENHDILMLAENVGLLKLERIIKDMRTLFQNDPIMDGALGQNRFSSTFQLVQSYNLVIQKVEDAVLDRLTVDLKEHIPLESAQILPVDTLVKLEHTLRQADISNFIRKQPICWLDSIKVPPKILGYEYYISLESIEDIIHSHTHLITDFALFKYLSILFDRKVLGFLDSVLKKSDAHQHFHINLNLRSVVSKEFFEFHSAIDRECVVEMDRTDVLWNLEGFHFACDFLKSYKHRVGLDLLEGPNLRLFTPLKLNCDFYKVIACPDLFGPYLEDFRAFMDHVGPEKIVLTRCDNFEVVQKAFDYGVTQFQGFLLDSVLRKQRRTQKS